MTIHHLIGRVVAITWLVVTVGGVTAGSQDREPIVRAGSLRVDLSVDEGLIYLGAPGLGGVPFELPRPPHNTVAVDYRIIERTSLSAVIDVRYDRRPCGRVQIAAVTASAVRVSFVSECEPGVLVRWRPAPSEELFGLFEDRGDLSLNLRGVAAPLLKAATPLSTQAANARAPFLFSQRGYAVYVESDSNGTFFIQTPQGTGFSYPDSELSFLVFFGRSPSDLLRQYSWFGGVPAVPPDWALGPIWWRDDAGDFLRGRRDDQQNLLGDLDYFREHGFPISALLIDRPFGRGERGWGDFDFDPLRFPDFGGLLARLRRDRIALMIWIANRAAGQAFATALRPSGSRVD
jgi:Glycosyl hydrolases family 31